MQSFPSKLGPGLFLRRLTHLSPRVAAEWLRWVCVPVLGGDGRPRNRDREWYKEATALGIKISTFHWLPRPVGYERGLAEAIEFTAEAGGFAFVLNAEREFRGKPCAALDYTRSARHACDTHGLALGFVSYSIPQTVKDFPIDPFAQICDFGIPEAYDREGAKDPKYPRRAVEAYQKAGFRHVIPGCGVYVRDTPTSKWRWRTAREIRDHLSLFPAPREEWIAWPLGGKVPEHVLMAMSA